MEIIKISEACEQRWVEWILSPYTLGAVLAQYREGHLIQGLHSTKDQTTNKKKVKGVSVCGFAETLGVDGPWQSRAWWGGRRIF